MRFFLYILQVPVTVTSGGWKEQFLWLLAHLIHLTPKKTERLWQTGQRKIVPWILIVEVNEQIGLEVCHLSVSRDAWVWIHPSTPVSPVTSWIIFENCIRSRLHVANVTRTVQCCIYKTKHYFRLPSDIREHLLYVYLFKYSWKESRNSVAGLWCTPAISLCQRKSQQYPPANM